MTQARLAHLLGQVQATQVQLSQLLAALADYQDWRPSPGQWSIRYIAAHLATTDRDCFLYRINRIAAGEQPHFAYYLDSDRDFSHLELFASLRSWAATRREIGDLLLGLPPEKLTLTGTHDTFGTITVVDNLQHMLDHDLDHLAELRELVRRHHLPVDKSLLEPEDSGGD